MHKRRYTIAYVITIQVSVLAALAKEFTLCGIAPLLLVKYMVAACAFFDLVFCGLFVYTATSACRSRGLVEYMLQRGWLEFTCSFPVFMLYSIPEFLKYIAGMGPGAVETVYGVELLCGIAGIAGILRVSRMATLASMPEIIRSPMTRRYIRVACNTAAASVICGSVILSACARFTGGREFASGIMHNGISFAVSVLLFLVITGILFICAEHFGRNVALPLSVMDRGFRRREFYLRANIPEGHMDDEIWRIAAFYNDSYLPAKMRQNMKSPEPALQRIPDSALDDYAAQAKKAGK